MKFHFFKDSGEFSLGDVSVQPRRNLIIAGGATQRVEPRVMAVLMRLKQAMGDVVSREALIEDVWGDEAPNDEALTQAISRLRRAIGDNPGRPEIIETIPKRGYRLMRAQGAAAADPRFGFDAVGETTNAAPQTGAVPQSASPGRLTQTHLLWAAIVILGGLFLFTTMTKKPKEIRDIEIFLEEE